jgi:hypothetical protein
MTAHPRISGDHALRLQLLAMGYEPVAVDGKAAVSKGWQSAAITPDSLLAEETLHPHARSTGLRTGKIMAMDNDIRDADHARIVQEIVSDKLGYTMLQRLGSKPEPMLIYRCSVPLQKVTIRARAPGANKSATVFEVLGKGQQFVAYGIHPGTGKAYEWPLADLAGEPSQFEFGAVTEVTQPQVREAVRALCAKLGELGYTDVSSGDNDATHAPSPVTGEPISEATLIDALSYLDPDATREEWIRIIAAIRAAPIPNDLDESKRRAIAHRFSRGDLDRRHRYDLDAPDRYNGPEDVDQAFDTMPPKVGGVGVGTILSAARKAGWTGRTNGQSAQEIFGSAVSNIETADSSFSDVGSIANKFRVIFPREMRNLPAPQYVVDPIVPDSAVTLIYGPPGSCKSFLILDLLASVAIGSPAFGKFRTVPGDTILCAGEAPYAIARKRWPSFCQARGITHPDSVRFAIVPAVPLVFDPSEIAALMQSVASSGAAPRIVALDTVARAIAGQDENDMRAAGLVTNAAERIRDKFKCAVVLVHHSGKDEDKGARGSSAFEGNVDAVFRVARDKDKGVVSLRCTKMKDADEPEPIHFKEQRVGESLVLDWIPKDEHASLTRRNSGPTRSDVGAALNRLGRSVTTHVLAVELAGHGATENEVSAMARFLQREAKETIRAYVEHHGTGGRDGTLWGIPSNISDQERR